MNAQPTLQRPRLVEGLLNLLKLNAPPWTGVGNFFEWGQKGKGMKEEKIRRRCPGNTKPL